jgi:hypothetical protein
MTSITLIGVDRTKIDPNTTPPHMWLEFYEGDSKFIVALSFPQSEALADSIRLAIAEDAYNQLTQNDPLHP